MNACSQCGALLRPGGRFCGQCGEDLTARLSAPATVITPVPPPPVTVEPAAPPTYPAPPPLPYRPARPPIETTSSRGRLQVVLAALVVTAFVAVVAVGVWWYFGSDDTSIAGPVPSTASPAPQASSRSVAAPSSAPLRSDPTSDLGSWAANDRTRAESLVGSWVPQISAKQQGLVVNGRTYTDQMILEEYLQARQTYDAVLVRSQDYSTFQRPGFWVVLVPNPSTTAAAANAWCTAQNFGPDDCFAKKISHTESPNGGTVHR